LKAVAVLWEDSAHLHFGWGDVNTLEYSKPIFCVTFGIIIEETSDFLVVVQSSDTELNIVSNSLKIPKKSIITIKSLPSISKLFPKHKKNFDLTVS
jgi:hypothetical protein